MGTPLPASRHGRASLLLRLGTAEELRSAELHPLGALLLVGTQAGEAMLFTTSSGSLVQRMAEPVKAASASAATCLAYAEFGGEERVVVGHKSGTVRVWDVERATVLATLAAHRADVGALASYQPLGLLATGSADTNIKLWGLEGAGSSGNGSSSDGGASAPAGQQRLAPLQVLKGHHHPITQLQFTPDGELLISGDAGGGLRVWQVAGGEQGRLLHDLTGHHIAGITGIACHPEERLFATCSLDHTLRVWDMDSQAGKCIGVHGPEGRREVRALTFTSTGRALLAAYPDGLRTFTIDPLEHQDTAEAAWKQVKSIRYIDGKAIGVSLHKGDASLFGLDLTKMRPFVASAAPRGRERSSLSDAAHSLAGSTAASAESSLEDVAAALASRLRFSEKHQVAGSAAAKQSASTHPSSATDIAAEWAVPPAAGNSAGVPAAGAAAAAAEAALAAARQRRQATVLGPKAVNSGPAVEVFAPSRHPAQPASFTAAGPRRSSSMPAGSVLPASAVPAAAGSDSHRRGPSGRASPGPGSGSSDGKGGCRPPRLSAEENAALGCGVFAGFPPKAGEPASSKPAVGQLTVSAADWQQQQQQQAMDLDVGSLRSFLANGLQRSEDLCKMLACKKGLWRDVRAALHRGDVREATRLLREAGDLSTTANVVESRALQRHADRFTLELCSEAVPLARHLLASACVRHRQAALQLLDAILSRWGGYVRDALSNAPRMVKVDLELERRQERSRVLRGKLLELAPELEGLAMPPLGPRAQQMLARLRAL